MKCSGIGKILSLYVDGELSERGRATVESHVQSCSDCERELEDLQLLKRMFDRAGRYQVPNGFTTKVIANAALQKKRRGASDAYYVRFAQVLALIVVLAVGLLRAASSCRGPEHLTAPP